MRKFNSKTIRALFRSTKNRVELIKNLPKSFHKQYSGLWRIEDKDIMKEWPAFSNSINDKLNTLAPEVILSERETSMLALYFHHIGLFFQHFSNEPADIQYAADISNFFLHHQAEVGPREETELFNNAFKARG